MMGMVYLALLLFGSMVVLGLCGLAVEKLCEAGYFQNLFGGDYDEEPCVHPAGQMTPSHKRAG
jgi:hypothetical protein